MPASKRACLLSRAAVVLALGSAACALAAACGTDTASVTPPAEGGAEDGGADAACPSAKNLPKNGSACVLPAGTTCDFGQCGTRLAQCTHGIWLVATNPPAKPSCPAFAPNPDVLCPACWDPQVTCRYGSTNCTLPDASENQSIATCADGGWVLDFIPCRDAGPDVQGDGGPGEG